MKKTFGHVDMDNMQMRPDMVSYWLGSLYKFQGYLGIDQKYRVVKDFGRNQVLVNPHIAYDKIIDDFILGLEKKTKITPEMREVLKSLKASAGNFEEHLVFWADNLHLFPKRWRPPLLLDKTFNEAHFSPEILEKIRRGEAILRKVSEQLYLLDYNEETGEFGDKALEIFNGSLIQQILGQD